MLRVSQIPAGPGKLLCSSAAPLLTQLLTQRYLVYLKRTGLHEASRSGDLSPFGNAAVGAEWHLAQILKQLNQAPDLY